MYVCGGGVCVFVVVCTCVGVCCKHIICIYILGGGGVCTYIQVLVVVGVCGSAWVFA